MPNAAPFTLFMPCAAGVELFLHAEVASILDRPAGTSVRGGVLLDGSWEDVLKLNLHSRLAQRVLLRLAHQEYRTEQHVYDLAYAQAWENWFTERDSFKIETSAQHCPLKSLNFAALKVKDAVADRFRAKKGARPNVDTYAPTVRIFAHFDATHLSLYIDSSGEALFKRGWRTETGEAPLKETLAAALLYACDWPTKLAQGLPLYDPCCGSGTIAIEAAQMARRIAPGKHRSFAFTRLLSYQAAPWQALKAKALANECATLAPIFASDVSFRMVDFAMHNAKRAGVADGIQIRGGDALERMPPCEEAGLILMNPPYDERIVTQGKAGAGNVDQSLDFFALLASHWKRNFAGWQAWVLSPDLKLGNRMRLKENRRVPLWNGPIECRLFCFALSAGRHTPNAIAKADTA